MFAVPSLGLLQVLSSMRLWHWHPVIYNEHVVEANRVVSVAVIYIYILSKKRVQFYCILLVRSRLGTRVKCSSWLIYADTQVFHGHPGSSR